MDDSARETKVRKAPEPDCTTLKSPVTNVNPEPCHDKNEKQVPKKVCIDFISTKVTSQETKQMVCKTLGYMPADHYFQTLKPDAIIEFIGLERFGPINLSQPTITEPSKMDPPSEYVNWIKNKCEQSGEVTIDLSKLIAQPKRKSKNIDRDLETVSGGTSVLKGWEQEMGAPGSAKRMVFNIKKSARLKQKEEAKRTKEAGAKFRESCLNPNEYLKSISPTIRLKDGILIDAELSKKQESSAGKQVPPTNSRKT